MRIIHFSDAHIGVESYGKIDSETGLSTRLIDFLSALDEVVAYAIDNRVDLVLFCGDAYKNRDPNQTHQREFAKRVALLSSNDIPVFLVVGNHDMPHTTSRATSLEIFPTLDVENVYIADRLDVFQVQTNDGPLQIMALPWIRRSEFLSREETRGHSPREITEAIQSNLTQIIQSKAKSLDQTLPAIFAGHVWITGATLASEQTMMLGTDHMLSKSDLSLPQFDYIALGHIHKHQILGNDPMIVYSGSLERVDFGEESHEKGFCVIDIDPSESPRKRLRDFRFVNTNARSFVTVSVQVPSSGIDPTQTVIDSINAHPINDAIVRVIITLSSETNVLLREEPIRLALDDAHYVASISRQIENNAPIRIDHPHPKSLQPIDALKMFLHNRGVSKDRITTLVRRAETIIQEDASEEYD